jgi:galactokinase
LDCRPTPTGEYVTRHIPFPTGYRLVVADSGVRHDNVRGEYNLRVAACRAGVGLLRRAYPGITHLRDVQEVAWADLAPLLPEVATADDLAADGVEPGEIPGLDGRVALRVAACCRHVWHENQRVLHTLEMLHAGDVAAAGAEMQAAHASAADDYAVSTPELDFLVNTALDVEGCVGARLTGAGWGGCIVALVAAAAVDDLANRLHTVYAATYGRPPAVFLCQAGPGAGKVGELTI